MSKILVIDDNKDSLISIREVLKILDSSYQVITAQGGEEGLEKAKKESPDTILLDISMPYMDGFEVCKLLKTDDATKHVPVVMLTAIQTDPRSRIKAFILGADAFLTKPIDEAELGAQINVMLRIKKAEDKLRLEKKSLEDLVEKRTKELQKSEAKFRELVSLLPEVIYETDEKGNLTFVNQNAFEVFGCNKEDLEKGINAFQMIAPIDRERAMKNFQEVLSGEKLKASEYAGLRKDGSTFPILIYSSLVYDDNKTTGLRGIVIDITKQKKIEKIWSSLYKISEAANTSDNLKELYSSIHEIVKELIPAKNLYITLYDKGKNMISFPYFVDEKDEKPEPQKFGKKGVTEYVLRTGKPLLATHDDLNALEKRGEVKLVGAKPVDWLGTPLKIKGKAIGVIAIQNYDQKVRLIKKNKDILVFVSEQIAMAIERVRTSGEIKQSREQLRSLVARIQSMREEEKIRMTYGIREDFSQILSVLKMDLSWLDKKFSTEQKAEHEKITSMIDLLDKTRKEVQKTSEELRSSQLDFLGLDAAIKWNIEEFQKRTGIISRFVYNIGEIGLSKNMSVTLYRIYEELIKNIEKHSKAKNVTVNFSFKNEKLNMKVTDDGIGMSVDSLYNEESLVLVDIKERLRLFNGEVKVKSTKGKGTTVTVSIPISEVKEKQISLTFHGPRGGKPDEVTDWSVTCRKRK